MIEVTHSLDAAVARVVADGNCSGCGACTLLDPGLSMQLSPEGFMRPVRVSRGGSARADPVTEFAEICPGRIVSSPHPDSAERHPQLGSYLEAWSVWATDPDARFRGASGGVLTSLSAWLTQTGRADRVFGAGPDVNPRRTVSVTITDRKTALAAAGSRYAPVAALVSQHVLDPRSAVITKPCEASALHRLLDGREPEERPLILSFFCAGVPSQHATDALVRELGVPDEEDLTALRYRGSGWPGRFTASTASRDVSMDYRTSWGKRLGPTMQWRCKICPDGVGESADLAVCDFWEVDERGYPRFDEDDGKSGLLVRTERGRRLLHDALAEGVLDGAPVRAEGIAAVQPGQTGRRETLFGRLMGARLGGVRVPRYRGFPLARLALIDVRLSIRHARGAFKRVRAGRVGR
ncbi:Coenzyme F420 hydrogenase/dehydrogenase, beta subunit C-terminal domain [Brachybacterium avium]|nr:Coenzyme F420 hydrogenase/dehydrogenase, beta subunit C-terminal domain [Brachybacterium avium]